MPYWTRELDFSSIFDIPIVLAPTVVVPSLVQLNSLFSAHQLMGGESMIASTSHSSGLCATSFHPLAV